MDVSSMGAVVIMFLRLSCQRQRFNLYASSPSMRITKCLTPEFFGLENAELFNGLVVHKPPITPERQRTIKYLNEEFIL
jgi:hypothetical protein